MAQRGLLEDHKSSDSDSEDEMLQDGAFPVLDVDGEFSDEDEMIKDDEVSHAPDVESQRTLLSSENPNPSKTPSQKASSAEINATDEKSLLFKEYKFDLSPAVLSRSTNIYVANERSTNPFFCYSRGEPGLPVDFKRVINDLARFYQLNGKEPAELKKIFTGEEVLSLFNEQFQGFITKEGTNKVLEHFSQKPTYLALSPITHLDKMRDEGIIPTNPNHPSQQTINIFNLNGNVYESIIIRNIPLKDINTDYVVGHIKGPMELIYKLTSDGFQLISGGTQSRLLHEVMSGKVTLQPNYHWLKQYNDEINWVEISVNQHIVDLGKTHLDQLLSLLEENKKYQKFKEYHIAQKKYKEYLCIYTDLLDEKGYDEISEMDKSITQAILMLRISIHLSELSSLVEVNNEAKKIYTEYLKVFLALRETKDYEPISILDDSIEKSIKELSRIAKNRPANQQEQIKNQYREAANVACTCALDHLKLEINRSTPEFQKEYRPKQRLLAPSLELQNSLIQKNNYEEIPALTNAVLKAAELLRTPCPEKHGEYEEAVKKAPGRSIDWKKWGGAALMFGAFLGTALLAVSVVATFGISLGSLASIYAFSAAYSSYITYGTAAAIVTGAVLNKCGQANKSYNRLTFFGDYLKSNPEKGNPKKNNSIKKRSKKSVIFEDPEDKSLLDSSGLSEDSSLKKTQ